MKPQALSPQRWIIFCRIVDYFGDAGFCWRLALALRALGVPHVILVIDRLNILDDLRGSQRRSGITVLPWNVAQDRWEKLGVSDTEKADVVVEAFACNPPVAYLMTLSPNAQWFTMDYLATEPWADAVHGALSPAPRLSHPMAARRRWLVPGFSKSTGGLLHGAWRHISKDERNSWRATLAGSVTSDVFLILAFGYADADWNALMRLAQTYCPKGKTPVLWRPQGIEYSQTEFDEILQSCDLNFVRGEDSFVRAHWAAAGAWRVPFIWQPYRQAERAHGHKLAGWLNQVARHADMQAFVDMHWAWNGIRPADSDPALNLDRAWKQFVQCFDRISQRLHKECLRLAQMESLESRLVKMVASANDCGPRS